MYLVISESALQNVIDKDIELTRTERNIGDGIENRLSIISDTFKEFSYYSYLIVLEFVAFKGE